MAKVGYARVSSVGQSLDVQREKLGGCDKLFEEKRSGTTDARPMLKQCLGYVREGDQLIVTRNRLARSTLHLCQIAETLQERRRSGRVLTIAYQRPVLPHLKPQVYELACSGSRNQEVSIMADHHALRTVEAVAAIRCIVRRSGGSLT